MTTEPTPTTPPRRELPANLVLQNGSHPSPDKGMCLMEAVAYFAGEPHSDAPQCACPVLTAHGIRLNDRWSSDERQLLAPLIPKLVGTRSTREVETKRVYSLIDSAIRSIAPMGLDAVGWKDLADRMRELAPVTDRDSARMVRPLVEAIRDEARGRREVAWKKRSAAAAAYAYAAAAAAYAAYAAADRAAARRPVVLATIAAFERAIDITA